MQISSVSVRARRWMCVVLILVLALGCAGGLALYQAAPAHGVVIPSIGDRYYGSCYIEWADANADTFTVTSFSGELDDAWAISSMRCLDHTAAAPSETWADYEATVTSVNISEGYVEYDVYITPPDPTDGYTRNEYGLTGYQHVGGKMRVARQFTGGVELYKESSNRSITQDNPCYSLTGAAYGIFYDPECTQQFGSTQRTGQANPDGSQADGYWKTAMDLTPGVWFVKETEAPAGYEMDTTVYSVTVNAGQVATLRVQDTPQFDRGTMKVHKTAASDTWPDLLAGAQYTLRYYAGVYDSVERAQAAGTPTRTWTWRSDEDGLIDFADESYYVGGDNLYQHEGAIAFPRGTYLLSESLAPSGFFVNTDVVGWRITDSTTGWHIIGTNEPQTQVTSTEAPVQGSFDLQKLDGELAINTAQGDATLEGAVYTVRNVSAHTVHVDGVAYAPGTDVLSVTTDARGWAELAARGLPYGDYEIRETQAPVGYMPSDQVVRFSIANDGFIEHTGTWPEQVIRGGVTMTKLDSELQLPIPLGGASIANAEFTIRNISHAAVLVDGQLYEPGADVYRMTTDEQGVTSTAADTLPYGTYEIRETVAPQGYLGTEETWMIEIRDNGVVYEPQTTEAYIDNQVMRSDLSFVKADETTGQRMAGIPFRITSEATGESHVIVTDANGMASTSNAHAAHDANTNRNDSVTSETDYRADCGVWFGLASDGSTNAPVRNGLGALPYGLYSVEELPVTANAGKQLISMRLNVYRDAPVIDFGTVDNVEPVIRTAAYDGFDHDKAVVADANATIIDKVMYDEVIPGRKYHLSATLFDAATGESIKNNGTPVVAVSDFTPTASNGTATVELVLDASDLAGTTVVVFEELSCDGRLLAEHTDLASVEQSVRIVERGIRTSARDVFDGDKLVSLDPESRICDEVQYYGLYQGTEYTLHGQIMVKQEDGSAEPLVVQGSEVRSQLAFTPQQSDGSVIMEFTCDTTGLDQDAELVIFEWLQQNGSDVAQHCDPASTEQTVKILQPEIATSAHDGYDQDNELSMDPETFVVDTVSYRNLIPGHRYQLHAQLMERFEDETGVRERPLMVNGEEVTQDIEFTALDSYGSVEVEFHFDSSDLADRTLVVFEWLSRLDRPLASHVDINDEAQAVVVKQPSIGTSAHDAFDGDRTIFGDTHTVIRDTVRYRNLIPQKSYSLHGWIMQGANQDAQALLDTEGKPVEAFLEFTPQTPDGEVDLDISLDTSALPSASLVVFEELSRDGRIIAQHCDPSSEAQTIQLDTIALQTCLTDAVDQDHEIIPDYDSKMVDTINYQNLLPSRNYTAVGIIMDADTGLPYLATRAEDAEQYADELRLFWSEYCSCLGIDEQDPSASTAPHPCSRTDVDILLAQYAELVSHLGMGMQDFRPSLSTGSVDLPVSLDTSQLIMTDQDRTLVAYEVLLCESQAVAYHADPQDEDQQIRYTPSTIATSASDRTDTDKELLISQHSIIRDAVTYQHLIPGLEYRITGVLMSKGNAQPLMVGDKPITSSVLFTPNSSDGVIEVLFDVDTTTLSGTDIVVYETLAKINAEGEAEDIAQHFDINDAEQTVHVMNSVEGSLSALKVKTGDGPFGMIAACIALATAGTALFAFRKQRALRQNYPSMQRRP